MDNFIRANKNIEKIYYAFKKRQALWLSDEVKKERGIKTTVSLIPNFPRLWERLIEQTPNGSCQLGSTLFWGEYKSDADLYVILNTSTHDYGGTPLPPITLPEPERVWGIHLEPPEYIKVFGLDRPAEHQKISRFYTSSESLYKQNPSKYIPSPPYVLMYIDRSWNFLEKASVPSKTQNLCMISSSLKKISGHRDRLAFIESLVDSDLEFSLWGRGEEFLKYPNYLGVAPNKWDVLAPCKYSIVVENSAVPFYWSEKISDCLLAFTLPLYYGSPNVGQFLPEDAYIPIDIHNPNCAEKIQSIVDSGEYEKRLPAILEARKKILHEQNLFAFLDREVNQVFRASRQLLKV